MTRVWVDDAKKKPVDKRWVMRCDGGFWSGAERCETVSEPSVKMPELWQFVAQGWWVSAKYDDICPVCLAAGVKPTQEPHRLMARVLEPAGSSSGATS